VYERQPGWARHLVRLAVSCGVMSAVLLLGLYIWPEWSDVNHAVRVVRLAVLVCAGGGAYLATQFAMGFRLGHLRAH
jgi:hypothetical protein